jgi:deoxyribose-phosphate aldolase
LACPNINRRTALFASGGVQVAESILRLIDHALLHPTLTDSQLREGCELGRRLGVASVCIKPAAILLAVEALIGSNVAVCAVIGCPHGSTATRVKTSTGFGYVPRPEGGFHTLGALRHDLTLMREHCGPRMRVKASGGIRSYADALRVVSLGAARIGTSSTLAIAEGERSGHGDMREARGY